MAMYKSEPRYTSGIGALEVVSPELRKALGIEKPQQFDPKTLKRIPREDETPRPFRPQGLGNIFVPEDTKQSAEARSMLGSGIMGQGVSPGFSQALTGSPVGASTQAEVLEALTNPQIIQDKASKIVDDFSEVNEASEINNKLQGLESDIVGIGASTTDDYDAGLAESTGATDEPAESTDTEENLTAAQTATKTALSEFLAQARPGIKPQTYDEYIKEFGDATGLDISGEPDTKQALMSFGLALMQNRAGKGFDISKILTATGEAGEAAMPDFRKAVAESKAVRAKAGEYALGKTKEDKNAAMNRKSYMIVPKGKKGGLQGLISGIGKGEYTQLNSYELNNLALNKKFNEQYEIVPSSTYADLAGKAITASTKTKKLYQKGKSFTPLFTGAPKGLGFNVQLPDANEAPTGTMPRFIDNPDIVVNQLVSMDKSLKRQEKTFASIAGLLEKTGTGVPSQLASSVVQGFRNLGLDVGGDTTPIAQIKTLLTRLKAENAAEILGEAGKTLSDTDRKMVSDIVGEISFTSGDEDELVRKVGNLYQRIITAGRDNVAEGYRNLSKAGVNINRKSVVSSAGKFTLGKDNIYDYTQTGE